MDSHRSANSDEKNIHGYRRRPHSLIEQKLGSQYETVENLLPFDRYLTWAVMILKDTPRTKEMEVTRTWLEFIGKNRDVPVMYDFIRLFVFSLHLRYRVRPFDANPKEAFLKQPRFDVVNAGRILISRLNSLEQKMSTDGDFACQIQRRDRHYSKCPKPIYGKINQPQKFFPLLHLSDNKDKNTKEYFATQGIPGFGRHCWYTIADDKFPYYYDQPTERNRKDILGRLADHLHNVERRKQRPITERDIERFKLTTRDWWNWRNPGTSYGADESGPEKENFRWYRHSILNKGVNYKLDKKHIKKVMDDEFKEVTLGYRPIPKCVLRNVLGLDIEDSSFSNVKIRRSHSRKYGSRSPSSSAKKASLSKWLDELDLSVSQDIPETRAHYFAPGSPCARRSTTSPFQKRTIQSPCDRRASSPCRRRARSPCPRRRSPSPCPRSRTPSPCPRSTPSPCPRRSTPSPCPRSRTPSPCPRSTPLPCPRRRTPSPCPRRTPSPCPRRTPSPCPRRTPSPCPRTPSPCPRTPSPCPRRRTPPPCRRRNIPPPCPRRNIPVFDTQSNIYHQDVTFTREIAERIGDPNGPPEIVNAAIGGWLDQLESSLPPIEEYNQTPKRPRSSSRRFAKRSTLFGGTSSPCRMEEESFQPAEAFSSESWGEQIEGDTYPDVTGSQQDFADEMAQFESQFGGTRKSSLDFGSAKESRAEEGFFRPAETFSSEAWGGQIEDDTYPDVTGSEQDFADEMAQFEAQFGGTRKSSQDFGSAKEFGAEEGFFRPAETFSSEAWGGQIEDDTYPDVTGSEQDFADEMAQFESQFGGTRKSSLDFENAQDPGAEEGFESWGEPIEGDTYPDVTGSEQDFADEMAQFEAQTGAGWSEKRSSLDFENAKELSFADQFILPTADIQFDEAAQDASCPFGGLDESDDDWVAPPEIVPCEAQEIAAPMPKDSETENRRAGKLFLPQPTQTQDTTELERISWPDRTHLFDINTDFPKNDKPFEFLEFGQFRNADDLPMVSQEIPEEEDRWLNLADIADQIGSKFM